MGNDESNILPEFTYTGEYLVVNDRDEIINGSNADWKIKFFTSGTLTFTNPRSATNGIDVFLVGGGGGGASWLNGEYYGAGGGGGYTTTKTNISFSTNSYQIVVGAGGSGIIIIRNTR